MENINVAQAFPPGDFIKEELGARGWSQQSLAEIMGRQTSVVSAVVNGKRAISLDIATELSSAFGTSVDYWMNLEKSYQQFIRNRPDDSISRRARLFQLAPVKEMAKRNWIEPSTDWTVIEKQVCAFLEIPSLDEEPKAFAHAAKKSSPEEPATPAQAAWLRRAKKLARAVQAAQFSEESFADAVRSIRRLIENPEDVRQVPKVLAWIAVRKFDLMEQVNKFTIIEKSVQAEKDARTNKRATDHQREDTQVKLVSDRQKDTKLVSDPTLLALLEKTRLRVITPEESEAQRQSWVRGEMAMDAAEKKDGGHTSLFPPASPAGAPGVEEETEGEVWPRPGKQTEGKTWPRPEQQAGNLRMPCDITEPIVYPALPPVLLERLNRMESMIQDLHTEQVKFIPGAKSYEEIFSKAWRKGFDSANSTRTNSRCIE